MFCFVLGLQSGGVWIISGKVSFSSCTITGNTAYYVRAHAQKFPSPRWEFLLTCPIDSHLSIRIDIWFHQGSVRASHVCKLPIAPMGKMLMRFLRFSLAQLRPTLRSTTGGACLRDLAKFPSPRWGKCIIDMSISILFVYDGCCLELPGCCTCYLCLKLQKFPWPRWDFHMFALACACRAAVSVFRVAR